MEAKMNKLNEIEKRNPFTVPDNYFININDEIMRRLPEKEIMKSKKITMRERAMPWIYMAAMFLGIFLIIQVLFKSTDNVQNQNLNNGISSMQYVNINDSYWNNVQISEEEFYQYLEEQLMMDGYYDYIYNQISLN